MWFGTESSTWYHSLTKPEKWFCRFAASTVLDLTRARNDDPGTSGSRLGADGFDYFDDIHAFNNRTKDNMLTIEPSSIRSAQEELTAIGSRASVCLYAGKKFTIIITLQWDIEKKIKSEFSACISFARISPCSGFQGQCASAWSFHLQNESHRWTFHQSRCGWWNPPPGTCYQNKGETARRVCQKNFNESQRGKSITRETQDAQTDWLRSK